MKIPECFAITIWILPMLVAAITLAVVTDEAFAESGRRPGTGIGNTETTSPPAAGGTAGIVAKPAPGGPIGKPLPPIPIDPGKGDGRVGHDGRSDHRHSGRHRYYSRWHKHRHKHSRYESPPIIGKDPGELFKRGVVGPRPGAGGGTTKPVPIPIAR
ncbi:hypothetical protein V1286_001347 [Bradyrhizobium algeriense]|uniref:Secreted protein n=1 Tax=Bradyrhizobium algeriense TaxID=634784 RepID=A0ABU8B5L5_9BRAD